MERIRGFLSHVCVICSLVCIIAKILDWYNPYMNFTGHIGVFQMFLYVSVIILGFTRKQIAERLGRRSVRYGQRTCAVSGR